jgi:hypothetical protein
MLVGYLRDVTGSYGAGFMWLIGVALAGAAAISLLPRVPQGRGRDQLRTAR